MRSEQAGPHRPARIYLDHGLTGTNRDRSRLGGTLYDPADPMGKVFFNIVATFAEFEVDLLRMGTREGMAVARAKGKLNPATPSTPGGQ